MSVLVTILWILGLTFLAVVWAAVAASLFEMARGALARSPRRPADARAAPASFWRSGLVAGAIGYGVVVVLYAGLNLLRGDSVFTTPALLGQSLLGRSPLAGIEAQPVLVYNGLHLVAFLALGVLAAWLLLESVRHPRIWYVSLVLLVFVFFHAIGAVIWLAAPAGSAIPPWSVVIATAGAGGAMAAYLLRARPGALEALRRADLEGLTEPG